MKLFKLISSTRGSTIKTETRKFHNIRRRSLKLHTILNSQFKKIWYRKSASSSSFHKDMNGKTSSDALKLVHVIFRHGARTNEKSYSYPNDPNRDFEYPPYGNGQLTTVGKQQAYQLGQELRRRYKGFLDETYMPGLIEARSTESPRTKTSLQLVLAGLFPPVGPQIWNEDLLWQPIPASYMPHFQDKLFLCWHHGRGKEVIEGYLNSAEYKSETAKHEKLLAFLSEKTGKTFKDIFDVFILFFCLYTEQNFGLELPEWTKQVYPEPIREITSKYYTLLGSTKENQRYMSGYMLKKIFNDSIAMVTGENTKTKMYLYSAHEMNIAGMLIALNLFEPHIPPYCAHIIIEVHTIDGVDGVKLFYQDYSNETPKIMKLPNCGEFCPLTEIRRMYATIMPDDDYLSHYI